MISESHYISLLYASWSLRDGAPPLCELSPSWALFHKIIQYYNRIYDLRDTSLRIQYPDFTVSQCCSLLLPRQLTIPVCIDYVINATRSKAYKSHGPLLSKFLGRSDTLHKDAISLWSRLSRYYTKQSVTAMDLLDTAGISKMLPNHQAWPHLIALNFTGIS